MTRDGIHQTMPSERHGYTRKFEVPTKVDGQTVLMSVYFSYGVYPDGRLGEVFIKTGKSGSLVSGALDAVAVMMSMALQRGVPLEQLLSKLRHMHFEPYGFTGAQDFPNCSSILDLLAQWLGYRFPAGKLCPDPDEHKKLINADRGHECPHCFPTNESKTT